MFAHMHTWWHHHTISIAPLPCSSLGGITTAPSALHASLGGITIAPLTPSSLGGITIALPCITTAPLPCIPRWHHHSTSPLLISWWHHHSVCLCPLLKIGGITTAPLHCSSLGGITKELAWCMSLLSQSTCVGAAFHQRLHQQCSHT